MPYALLPVLTFLFPLHAHDRAHARTTLAHDRGTRIAGRTRAADLDPWSVRGRVHVPYYYNTYLSDPATDRGDVAASEHCEVLSGASAKSEYRINIVTVIDRIKCK